MGAGWLAVVGIAFLLAGLAALSYDTLRRRRGRSAYPFPDSATNRLDESQASLLLRQPNPAKASNPSGAPHAALPLRRRLALPKPRAIPSYRPRIPRVVRRAAISWQLAAFMVVLVAACAGLLLAATFFAGSRATQVPRVPGVTRLAICPFAGPKGAPQPASTLAGDLQQQNSQGAIRISMLDCPSTPATEDQAIQLVNQTEADVLLWGTVAAEGPLNAVITLRSGFAPQSPDWERWTEDSPSALLLPEQIQIRLPQNASISPVEPLIAALADLASGRFQSAQQAARGAADTLQQAGATGEPALIVQAVAAEAAGDNATSAQLFSRAEGSGPLPVEAALDRARALIASSNYSDAQADLDRVPAQPGTPASVQSAARTLRSRILRLSGDLGGAVGEASAAIQLDPSDPLPHYEKALALYAQSQPDLARGELEQLVRAHPDHAPAHLSLALVWLMLGKPDSAQSSLASAGALFSGWQTSLRAVEAQAQISGDTESAAGATQGIVALDQQIASVHLYRAMALGDQAKREPPESFFGKLWRTVRKEPTTYDKAIAEIQEARRLAPQRLDVLLEASDLYLAAGDTSKGVDALNQAIQLSPDSPQPYLSLARVQESQGEPADAEQTFNTLIARSPGTFEAYSELYTLLQKQGKNDDANATLRRALQVPAQTASGNLWRGKFYLALGDTANATTELQAATADPTLWEAHLLLGKTYQAARQNDQALSEFQAALQSQPNQPDALLQAGNLLAAEGKPDDAGKLYSQLVTVAPDSVQGHIGYAQLLLTQGRYTDAVNQAKQAVHLDPANAGAHFALAQAYEAQHDWSTAAGEYAETARRDPTSAEALMRMAVVLFKNDQYNESLDASAKEISLRPDDPQGYRWAAEAHLAQMDAGAALSSIRIALQLSPEMPEALALAARAYALKGDWQSAEHYANASASAAPANPAGPLALGDVLLAENRPDDALQAFQAAERAPSEHAEAITGEGRCYSAEGDQQKAINAFNSALENDPSYAPAHLYMGHSLVALDRWDDALREYSRAVAMRPHWPEALYYQGRAFVERKDLRSAANAFKSATVESPNMAEAWYGLGIAQRGLNDDKDAIESLTKVTQLNLGYADAWLYLGLSYEEMGDRASAARAFQSALNAKPSDATRQQAEQGLQRVR